jgi:hypothetical protein
VAATWLLVGCWFASVAAGAALHRWFGVSLFRSRSERLCGVVEGTER